MTNLEKEQIGASHPFLKPYEAELAGKAKIDGEPFKYKSKFDEGDEKSNAVHVILFKMPTRKQYESAEFPEDDIVRRLDDKIRTWSLNATSFNHLIDTLGNESKNWVGKTVEFDVTDQFVKGKKIPVIYAEGSG